MESVKTPLGNSACYEGKNEKEENYQRKPRGARSTTDMGSWRYMCQTEILLTIWKVIKVSFQRKQRYNRGKWGDKATQTAKDAKTSLENLISRNRDYLEIIKSCLHSIFLTKYASKWKLGALLKKIKRIKELLFCVHVVFKTLQFPSFIHCISLEKKDTMRRANRGGLRF